MQTDMGDWNAKHTEYWRFLLNWTKKDWKELTGSELPFSGGKEEETFLANSFNLERQLIQIAKIASWGHDFV